MKKREVLIDTVFLGKLSNDGKNIETFKKIMSDLEYSPVVHPYIANNELDMYPYFNKLVDEGVVRVAEYSEFLNDEEDEKIYQLYFLDIHNRMREYLESAGGKKQLEELILPKNQTVFSYRKASMSLGDVHIILMAFFMKLPIILTNDSDIALLQTITKSVMSSDAYSLGIYSAIDVLIMIAQKEDTVFSKQELIDVVKAIGERKYLSEVKQQWNCHHQDT